MTTRYEASAAAAKELGVAVLSFGVGEPNDFEDAFEAMKRDKPDGLLMVADAHLSQSQARLRLRRGAPLARDL